MKLLLTSFGLVIINVMNLEELSSDSNVVDVITKETQKEPSASYRMAMGQWWGQLWSVTLSQSWRWRWSQMGTLQSKIH